jgi:serine acetyltransferase
VTGLDFIQYHIIDSTVNAYWCIVKRFPLRLLLCDVNCREIPGSTWFGHPYGLTIRDGTRIGENCTFASNVTIGQKTIEEERAVIGNNVQFGAGAIILGPVRIGDNAIIAAGSIVLTDVPPNATYISKRITEVTSHADAH